ncbi:MAG: F0F1 ATP synthase subunit A [Acidobacteriia bacterium]|nr:F0F1 ATP synthase subunit A [Terriglobia bacterium]
MPITPDHTIYWHWGFVQLNCTIVFTWAVMLLLTVVSWLVTRRLNSSDAHRSRWQNALEAVVEAIRGQIRQMAPQGGDTYLPFIGTLFLFIAVSNLLEIVPGWHAPTGSLSTTSALAICVGVAVPLFGILRQGVVGYFSHYLKPSFIMLPFHLLSETSRNLALAIRLFGNIMSGSIMVAILLAIAPLFFPLPMHALGLLIGLIQAYIFAVLAMIYIAAAVQSQREPEGGLNG